MRRRSLALATALVVSLVAGCNRQPSSILKADARFPSAEGIATEVTLEKIQLDSKQTFVVGKDVESFTTRSHETTPLLTWQGKYIQLGLNGDQEIIWVAGVGTVVKMKPPFTLYTGVFDHVDDKTGRAVFGDGTTLKLGPGVKAPKPGESLVKIDPKKRIIISITSV